ncbi:hypothetical protein RB201_05090 [Streptomyces sp. S1A(2023)]
MLGDGRRVEAVHQSGVVVGYRTEEHTGPAARERVAADARALRRLPAQFEGQPLLGVHGGGFARRDPEELGVERRHVAVEEAAPDGHRAEFPQARRVESVPGYFRDRVLPFNEKSPEFFGIRRTGYPACHSDHGNGFVRQHGIVHHYDLILVSAAGNDTWENS